MECVVDANHVQGYMDLSRLDYTSLVAGVDFVNPSVWWKYMDLARDWIFEQLQLSEGKSQLKLKWLNINFTPAASEQLQPRSSLYLSVTDFLQIPFRFHCSLEKFEGNHVYCFHSIENLKSGAIIGTASSCSSVVNPAWTSPREFISLVEKVPRPEVQRDLQIFGNDPCQHSHVTGNVYETNMTASYFDTKVTGEVIAHMYLDMCLNGADEAVRSDFSDYFKESIARYAIKRVAFHSLRDCFHGDNVNITMWVDPMNMYNLQFKLECANQLVCQMTLEFYAPATPAHL